MAEHKSCDHCGEDCGRHPIVHENKYFCCNGCKTVYQILNQNQLNKYYEINTTPGIKVDEKTQKKFAFLDLEEIKTKLIKFKTEGATKVTFYIPTIHCASCIWLLENLHTLHKGVKHSIVHFVKKEVSITFNEEEISLRELAELLTSIAYTPEINLENIDNKENKRINRKLLYKIGVAAFAFGNIMLISLPEYLSHQNDLEDSFKIAFAWINFVLSLPVILYSANDYIISAWKNIRKKIVNLDLPLAIGIIALFGQSTFELITQTGPGYFDSLAGFVFFLLIGKWYQNYTYQALSFERDYKSYFPVAVTKITNGIEEVIPLSRLQKDDRILIRNNELIPADAILVKGSGNIDYSFVTGESVPVQKLIDDPVYAGGRQTGEAIEIKITKKVEQSQLTQLWNEFENEASHSQGLSPLLDKVSQYFVVAILFIAIISVSAWYFIDPSKAILILTSVLIVACPCALALSVPFAFGNTMRVFGKKGFYLKNTQVVEMLSKIKTIVFDKTGTITRSGNSEVVYKGKEMNEDELVMVNSVFRQSAHPLSVALYRHLKIEDLSSPESYEEIHGKGSIATIHSNQIRIGSAAFIIGKKTKKQNILNSEVHIEINKEYYGYFSLSNEYRPGSKELFAELRKNFDLHLLSGDNNAELENMKILFGDSKQLNFNQSPQDKLHYIEALKAKSGNHIMMIGDGLNDAGALAASTIGISIADDIYQFSPACDAILESERFYDLESYIKAARKSMIAVYISFGLSFLYNIFGLFFAVTGNLSPIFAAILMPISSVSVVAFVTAATSIIARRTIQM